MQIKNKREMIKKIKMNININLYDLNRYINDFVQANTCRIIKLDSVQNWEDDGDGKSKSKLEE